MVIYGARRDACCLPAGLSRQLRPQISRSVGDRVQMGADARRLAASNVASNTQASRYGTRYRELGRSRQRRRETSYMRYLRLEPRFFFPCFLPTSRASAASFSFFSFAAVAAPLSRLASL
mmetsp:Transcript_14709/g.55684  ORF Transcript_14709/g.55684 Transcript_14709/m.55684 type:complete len:120 (-) Transcript_14709:1135-1494(-)